MIRQHGLVAERDGWCWGRMVARGTKWGELDHFRRSPEGFPHPLSSQEMGTTSGVLEINRYTTAHSNGSRVWARSVGGLHNLFTSLS